MITTHRVSTDAAAVSPKTVRAWAEEYGVAVSPLRHLDMHSASVV
jgi:hypothetical protein